MGKHLLASAALAIALLVLALPAQLRRPCFGTVLDGEDRPLSGADVTLVWSPGIGRPGLLDVVRVASDARGRFKADLVVGHGYSAWAIGAAAADGTRWVSEVTDRAAAGVVLDLPSWHRWQPRRLLCQGHEPWVGDRAWHLVVFPDGRNGLSIVLPAVRDGGIDLPPLPWSDAAVGLVDDQNGLLQIQRLAAEAEAPRVVFVAPVELAVTVTGPTGEPLAGAVIERLAFMGNRKSDAVVVCDGLWLAQRLGVTDVAGAARVLVSGGEWLHAGQAGGLHAYAPTKEARADPDSASGLRCLSLEVAKGEVAAGALRGLQAGEVASAELQTMVGFDGKGTSYSLAVGLPMAVNVTGQLGLDSMPCRAQTGAITLELLPGATGTSRHAMLGPTVQVPGTLPVVDLDRLRRWRLSAVDQRNNPLPGAAVMVFPTAENSSVMRNCSSLVLDHTGRAELLLDESEWAIYVTNGAAHAIAFVDAGGTAGAIDLQVQALPSMRCRVVDAAGRAVRWARVDSAGRSGFSGSLIGARGRAKELVASRIAFLAARSTCSDREGMLSIPVQDWRQMTLTVRLRAGSLQSELFAVVAGAEVTEVVMR